MTYQTPCQTNPKPDDWFISKDGKQHPDDDFLTEAEVRGLRASVLAIDGESIEEHQTRQEAAVRQARTARKRAAITARRHAKEACRGCYLRTACLQQAMTEDQRHGTWGGYYEEELREIRIEVARRKKKSTTT